MINCFSSLEIPYRLETAEDIKRVMNSDLVGAGSDFKCLISLSRTTSLCYPPAFIHAKKRITKDFVRIREDKIIQDAKVSYHQVANLSFIDQYPLVLSSIQWVHEITCHENLFQFIHTFPLEIRERCLVKSIPGTPDTMYAAVLAIRRFLRREMINYVKTSRTSCLSPLQLKQFLVALTIFDPNNEDILEALKTQKSGDSNSVLYQNAMAELLFSRIPKTIDGLLRKNNPDNLAQKLRSRMFKLEFSPRQIMSLMGYIKPSMTFDDLFKTLDKIAGVATRMTIPQDTGKRLQDYIESMKRNIEHAPLFYRTIFLSRELETYQKLYKPTRIMQSETTFESKTVKTYIRLTTLDFYPTKDYLDILKGKISNDCTGINLGEKQLLTPHFFNIRIFQDKDWIGNIYMLDFSSEHGSLIIDRIQVPRDLNVFYHHFFDHLRDVLIEMFANAAYKNILMPLTISNHATIQKNFNDFKKGLSKTTKMFDSLYNMYFESLCNRRTYYVLHERPKELAKEQLKIV